LKWRGFSVWTLLIMGLLFMALSALVGFIFSLLTGTGLLISIKFGTPAVLIGLAVIIGTSLILTGMLVVIVYQWGARRG